MGHVKAEKTPQQNFIQVVKDGITYKVGVSGRQGSCAHCDKQIRNVLMAFSGRVPLNEEVFCHNRPKCVDGSILCLEKRDRVIKEKDILSRIGQNIKSAGRKKDPAYTQPGGENYLYAD